MKLVVKPLATVAVVGAIAMAVSAGAVTFNVVAFDVIPLAAAVTVDAPCASVDAMPLALRVATVALLDSQFTEPEIFPVVPSE